MAGIRILMPKVTNSKTFCAAPWTGLNIDQTGLVMPCQMTDYKLGNLQNQTIQEILVSEPLRELRNTMIRGEWHPACAWCKQREDTSGCSARTTKLISDDIKSRIDQDAEYFHLTDLAVNWSNLCNISCVYCNPHTSTAWQSVKGIPIVYTRNKHQDLVSLAQEHGMHITGLMLGGGEPLLQKLLPEFLDHLNPQICRVVVTTNLSMDITNNAVYRRLREWPIVTWMISFDNANPQRFEYVRHGAKWDQFYQNINQLRLDKQQISAHPAYSIYCALDLENYYAFCHNEGLDLFWCELTHPWDLDARRMPLLFRQRAIEVIDTVTKRYPNMYSETTLLGYRQTLVDPAYIVGSNYQPRTRDWHRDIEKELGLSYKFEELWPEEANYLP